MDMPTKYGHFKLIAFKEKNTNNEHLALIKGEWKPDEPVLGAGAFVLLHGRYPGFVPLRLRRAAA